MKITRNKLIMADYKQSLVKQITNKVLTLIADEINKSETQLLVKNKIIHPVINLIYAELYPYIIALIITILVILVLSILTFLCFVIFYLRK